MKKTVRETFRKWISIKPHSGTGAGIKAMNPEWMRAAIAMATARAALN